MIRLPSVEDRRVRYGVVLALAVLIVIVIDVVTNDLNTKRYYWDFALYLDMAEHGLAGNDNLYAPFVYRFVTPLLAGLISDGLGCSTWNGFKVVAYVGGITQLVAAFVLAEYMKARFWQALVVMATVALTLYQLKFLIFDVTRPDHLAYALMIVATWALFERRYVICVAASCLGLLIREFMIIPAVLLMLTLARDYWATRSRHTLVVMAITLVMVSLFVIVPRAVIPIAGTGQFVDPVNDSSTLSNLTRAPQSKRRLFNIFFNFVSYTVPIWMLLTVPRLRRAWAGLAGYRWMIGLHTVMVLVLALYGGTDIWRFMTFLVVPQVIVLAVLLRDETIDPVEILYVLVVMLVYNKILLDIPNWIDQYLDFYGGYDIRITTKSLMRGYHLAVFWSGIVLMRGLLVLARRGWTLRGVPAAREETGRLSETH